MDSPIRLNRKPRRLATRHPVHWPTNCAVIDKSRPWVDLAPHVGQSLEFGVSTWFAIRLIGTLIA